MPRGLRAILRQFDGRAPDRGHVAKSGTTLFPNCVGNHLENARIFAYTDLINFEVIGITMTYAAFAFSWMSVALFAAVLLA